MDTRRREDFLNAPSTSRPFRAPARRVRYRSSAAVIEASDLDYTIVRPAWLNDRHEIDYRTTRKGPAVRERGRVSRKSVADLVVKLALTPGMGLRESLGVNKA